MEDTWRLVSINIHIIDINVIYSNYTRFGYVRHIITKMQHTICDPIPKGAFYTMWVGMKCLNDLYLQTNVFWYPYGNINTPHLSQIKLLNSRFPSRNPGGFEAATGVWSNCCWHAHVCPADHITSCTYHCLRVHHTESKNAQSKLVTCGIKYLISSLHWLQHDGPADNSKGSSMSRLMLWLSWYP